MTMFGLNVSMGLPLYDKHTEGHHSPTVLQLALFQLWLATAALALYRFLSGRADKHKSSSSSYNSEPLLPIKSDANSINSNSNVVDNKITEAAGEVKKTASQNGSNSTKTPVEAEKEKTFSKIKPPPTFDEFLRYLVILGVIMLYFFLTDYVKVMPRGPRVYARDTFLFLVFMLFLIGCAFTIKPTTDKILNRDQTEEWKGWMQVMFVWYHYFAAAEWYNWIRIYIAAYVWMTGFGNFSFFYIKGDYSIWRVIKMLFRLNFFVLLICAVVSNEYMLYYICAMHTHWFLSVWVMMGIYPSWNKTRWTMILKFAIYAFCNAFIFDVHDVALYVFRPLWLLLGFNDGTHDIMHEWAFRAGLDHWVAFIGMICAYNYPHYEAFILKLEQKGGWMSDLTKLGLAGAAAAVFFVWHGTVLSLEKYEYNKFHPYTSFIPILCFIVCRNLYPALRTRYVYMFAFLGRITLETYLSQLHIYLQTNAKELIVYLDGYPLLNFALSTTLYLILSYIIFNLTTEFSAYLLPKDLKVIGKNIVIFAAMLGCSCALGKVILLMGLV